MAARKTKNNKEYDLSMYSVFLPRGKKKLANQYPELANHPDISSLKKSEQLICWYLGCEASPISEYYQEGDVHEKRRAIRTALLESGYFRTNREDKIETNRKREWMEMVEKFKFSSHLIKGIRAFESYLVDKRIQTMISAENAYNNQLELLSIDTTSDEFYEYDDDGKKLGRDYDKIAKFTGVVLKVRKELKEALNDLETQYSVVLVTEEEKESLGSLLDEMHENNK